MKRPLASLIILAGVVIFTDQARAEETIWRCPDGEYAQNAIISGEVESWPNLSKGPGMRVQSQYPETALLGQSKYIEGNDTSGAICQYYNHIGTVVLMIILGAKKHETDKEGYWRTEYKESFPEQDDPDNPTIDVCMTARDGRAYISTGCPFLVP